MKNPFPKREPITEEELRKIISPFVNKYFDRKEKLIKSIYIFDKHGNDITRETIEQEEREYVAKKFKDIKDENNDRI